MDRIKTVLEAGGRPRTYEKNAIIFREGEKAYHFYIVMKGKIKIVNSGEEDKEFLVDIFTDNMSFGHSALFNNGYYTSTAIAIVRTEVVSIEQSLYFRLLQENFEFHYSLTSTLSMRLRMQLNKIKSFSFGSARDRIIHVFNRLQNASTNPQSDDFPIEFTRREIGELTGLRTETVIRNVKKMETEGVVSLEGRKIIYHPKEEY